MKKIKAYEGLDGKVYTDKTECEIADLCHQLDIDLDTIHESTDDLHKIVKCGEAAKRLIKLISGK